MTSQLPASVWLSSPRYGPDCSLVARSCNTPTISFESFIASTSWTASSRVKSRCSIKRADQVMRLIVMFLLIFAPTSCALAQGSWTGKEFLDACKVLATSVDPKNDPDDPVLVGYCAGMVHTLMIPGKYSGFKICPPENATVQQGATVLVKFSDDHPQQLNLPAVRLALAAFRNAWPCPDYHREKKECHRAQRLAARRGSRLAR